MDEDLPSRIDKKAEVQRAELDDISLSKSARCNLIFNNISCPFCKGDAAIVTGWTSANKIDSSFLIAQFRCNSCGLNGFDKKFFERYPGMTARIEQQTLFTKLLDTLRLNALISNKETICQAPIVVMEIPTVKALPNQPVVAQSPCGIQMKKTYLIKRFHGLTLWARLAKAKLKDANLSAINLS